MPMQIVFPISMVAVGVTGAAALMVVGNHLLFHKVRIRFPDVNL